MLLHALREIMRSGQSHSMSFIKVATLWMLSQRKSCLLHTCSFINLFYKKLLCSITHICHCYHHAWFNATNGPLHYLFSKVSFARLALRSLIVSTCNQSEPTTLFSCTSFGDFLHTQASSIGRLLEGIHCNEMWVGYELSDQAGWRNVVEKCFNVKGYRGLPR